ncbi:MAG TPA: polymer-forming cytoskeletal protein [Candidatus Acidoferrales bacterium]|nr:polymer-forming cytoskeletal protein [Candidatus Acidoferrales bacterium]
MWGKKPEQQAAPEVSEPKVAAIPPKPAPAIVEEKKMSTDAMRPVSGSSSGASARLGASLHVKGEITGHEDLLVDGSVEGLIQLEDRKLTVGASAKVSADVVAREVVVYGNVKGNLRARDRIEIKKDGSVVGDLTTARIMIEDGAYFKGSIEIDKAAEASSSSHDSKTDLERPAYTRTVAATAGSTVGSAPKSGN